jgi:hypothetical protein
MEHHGVSLTADIQDRYPDQVNIVIVIVYSLCRETDRETDREVFAALLPHCLMTAVVVVVW